MYRLLRMTRIRAMKAVLIAMALALIAPAGAAVAAPAFKNIGVSLLIHSQGSQPLLLVSGVLPDETPLPAEVALPVPPGAEIEWAGEILGQSIDEDIAAEAVIEDRDGVTVAVFTLTTSRVGQVEVVYSDATRPGADGTSEAAFSVVSPASAETVRLAIALPPGGTVASVADGVLAAPGPDGYTYYYTDVSDVSGGDPLEMSLGYTLSATPQQMPANPAAPSSEVPPLLIALLAAVFGGSVLMFLASRARASAAVVAADEPEADYSFDDEEVPVSDEPVAIAEETGAPAVPVPGEVGNEPPAAGATGFLTPRMLLIVAAFLILGVVLAINLAGGEQVGMTSVADGLITQRISTVEAVQQADYTIRILCQCPPEEEAVKIFAALGTQPGVATASLEPNTLLLSVGYDPALTDEAAIRGVLQSKGYVP